MIKKLLIIFSILFTTIAVQAYEDCIVSSDGKLTNIKIEDNTVVDVFPLVTVLNEKNMLIVHPLKEGETKVCVLKNDKNIIDFNVIVKENETIINEVEGLDIFTLDEPEPPLELDLPPEFNEKGEANG